MYSFYLTLFVPFLAEAKASAETVTEPVVTIKNGTYVGLHSSAYNQDFFLGIPYARTPVGNLRFRIPQPLDTAWTGIHLAKEYSPEVRV
jgi:carboxylesterase type B